MPRKKNPLEDARNRLREKLSSIKEQSDYITQFVNDYVEKAAGPARDLLKENNRKAFFNKYSYVNEELEKCLDCLLLVSDSLTSQEEEDLEIDTDDSEGKSTVSKKESDEKLEKSKKADSDESFENKSRDGAGDGASNSIFTGSSKILETNFFNEGDGEKPTSSSSKQELSNSTFEEKKLKQSKNSANLCSKQDLARNECLKSEVCALHTKAETETFKLDLDEKRTSFGNICQEVQAKPMPSSKEDVSPKCKILQKCDNKQDTRQIERSESPSELIDEKVKSEGKKKSGKKGSNICSSKSTNALEMNAAKCSDKTKTTPVKTKTSPVKTTNLSLRTKQVSRTPSYTEPEIGKNHVIQPYPFENGSCLEVVVTEVLSPWELWIEPCGSTELDSLLEQMCMHYAKVAKTGYTGGVKTPPGKGEFCCGKLTNDNTWYRVLVTEVYLPHSSHQTADETMVEVLCVDDGAREQLPLSRLRPLEERFAQLPCQALCCALSGVLPLTSEPTDKGNQSQSIWSKESTEWLKCKVSGRKLLAYPMQTTGARGLVLVDLYQLPSKSNNRNSYRNSSSCGQGDDRRACLPGLQFSIAEMMVKAGFAQRIYHNMLHTDSQSLSPRSTHSEGSLLRSCSTVSIDSSYSVQDIEMFYGREGLVSNTSIAQEPKLDKDESLIQYNKICPSSLERIESENVEDKVNNTNLTSNEKTIANFSSCQDEVHAAAHIKEKEILEKDGQSKANLGESVVTSSTDYNQNRSPDTGRELETDSKEEHFAEDYKTPALPSPAYETCIRLMVAHIINPSKFYVHLVTPEAAQMRNMWDELNKFYDGDLLDDKDDDASQIWTSKFIPKVGDFCCARFSQDRKWYRAQVLTVTNTNQAKTSAKQTKNSLEDEPDIQLETELEVFYIDFGDTEWISSTEVRFLLPRFMKLPSQVVRCSLANIVPFMEEAYEMANPVINHCVVVPDMTSSNENASIEEAIVTKPSKKRKRNKSKKGASSDSLDASPGQSSSDSKLEEAELEKEQQENRQTSSSVHQETESEKGCEEELLLGDNLVKPKSPLSRSYWSPEAVELFKGLTDDDRQLVGYLVDQDPEILQQVLNPIPEGTTVMGINYRRPSMKLDLFDTNGEEDIFINQVLVETGVASFHEKKPSMEGCTKFLSLSVDDLEETVGKISGTLEPLLSGAKECSPPHDDTCQDKTSPSLPMSPTSPVTQMMKDWDPMAKDYFSNRNAYDLDTDDAEVAVQGYKYPSTKVCSFHNNKSGCWKGDKCPNLHIMKAANNAVIDDVMEAFCDNIDSGVELPELGTWVAIKITAIFNPGHFWAQLPYGTEPLEKLIIEAKSGRDVEQMDYKENLDSLMAIMRQQYAGGALGHKGSIPLAIGELVAAKYSEDGLWYRARVTDLRENELQVFFVDYGNSEWTAEENIGRMLPHFLHLPFQAVECFLGNVDPTDGESGWSDEAKEYFKDITADKILVAHVLSRAWNQTLYLDLYETTDGYEMHINKDIVEKGHAKEAKNPLERPWNIETMHNKNQIITVPG